jgi:DNA topoisomerase VI subunit B
MKLKQKLALGLCTFYLFSVIGIALSMHFCGGKLASVTVYSNKAACKFCKTEAADKKDDGCCKNTKVEVKVKDNHQSTASFKLPKLFNAEYVFHPFATFVLKKITATFFNKIENKAPPALHNVARHLLNCVFRN